MVSTVNTAGDIANTDYVGQSLNSGGSQSGRSLSAPGVWDILGNWSDGSLDYQRDLQKLGYENAFNAHEAEKARNWQTYMSNTAYQRAVSDLKKAGLNPYLAYGNGASTGSGVSAHSGSGGVGRSGDNMRNLLQGIISVASQLALGMHSNATQMAIASGKNNTAIEVARLGRSRPAYSMPYFPYSRSSDFSIYHID